MTKTMIHVIIAQMSKGESPKVEVSDTLLQLQPEINSGLAVRGLYVGDASAFGSLLQTCGVEPGDVANWSVAIEPSPGKVDTEGRHLAVDLDHVAREVHDYARREHTTPYTAFTENIGEIVTDHVMNSFGLDAKKSSDTLTPGVQRSMFASGVLWAAVLVSTARPNTPIPLLTMGATYGAVLGASMVYFPQFLRKEREINRSLDPKYRQVAARLSKTILPTFFEPLAD